MDEEDENTRELTTLIKQISLLSLEYFDSN